MFPTSTKGSVARSTNTGSAVYAFPDVCHTPLAGGTPPQGVPTPYPNAYRGNQAATSAKVTTTSGPVLTKGSAFGTSTGDEVGVGPMKNTSGLTIKKGGFNVMGAPTTFLVGGSIASTAVMMGNNVAPSLRNQLNLLHAQLGSLPGNDPNRWHSILDEYVLTAAELYKALAASRQ